MDVCKKSLDSSNKIKYYAYVVSSGYGQLMIMKKFLFVPVEEQA
jgi:hypothetical protein